MTPQSRPRYAVAIRFLSVIDEAVPEWPME